MPGPGKIDDESLVNMTGSDGLALIIKLLLCMRSVVDEAAVVLTEAVAASSCGITSSFCSEDDEDVEEDEDICVGIACCCEPEPLGECE